MLRHNGTRIFALIFITVFLFYLVFVSVPVSDFARGPERGLGFREKIRCPGVAIGL